MRQPLRLHASDRDRLGTLESRADGHDKLLKPMAEQLGEIYEIYTRVKNINWFLVKLFAYVGGFLGFCAVVLTVISGVQRLVTGH